MSLIGYFSTNFVSYITFSGTSPCPCSPYLKEHLQKDQQRSHRTTVVGGHLAFRLVGKHQGF